MSSVPIGVLRTTPTQLVCRALVSRQFRYFQDTLLCRVSANSLKVNALLNSTLLCCNSLLCKFGRSMCRHGERQTLWTRRDRFKWCPVGKIGQDYRATDRSADPHQIRQEKHGWTRISSIPPRCAVYVVAHEHRRGLTQKRLMITAWRFSFCLDFRHHPTWTLWFGPTIEVD